MKKDIFWNSLGTATWSFLSLFLLIVVTRVNGIADSGLFSFALSISIIMFTVSCYGGRAYQVSDHKDSFAADSYISLRLLTSLGAILVTAGFIFINDYDSPKAILIFLLVGQRIFDAIADVFYGIMQKKHHLHIAGKSLFYRSVMSFAIFLAIDLLTGSLLLSALSLPIISLLFVLLYDIPRSSVLEKFNIKLKLDGVAGILRSTFLPFAVTMMGLIFVNLARYFIDIYYPDLQGYFGIIIMPLSLVVLLFSFIFTPAILHISDTYNNRKIQALHKSIRKMVGLTFGATVVLSILAYLFGTPLFQLLFGVDFTNYSLDIVLVVLIGFAISLTSLFTNVAIIARKLRPVAFIYLLANALLVFLCASLVSQYQIRGAIVAYIIASSTQAIMMGLYYMYVTKNYKLSRKS